MPKIQACSWCKNIVDFGVFRCKITLEYSDFSSLKGVRQVYYFDKKECMRKGLATLIEEFAPGEI